MPPPTSAPPPHSPPPTSPSSSSTPPSPLPLLPSPPIPLHPSSSSPPWPHSRRFQVQYAEIDVLGHLNHVVYFRFMETLRCEYYLGVSHADDPRGLGIIIAEATCRYLAPVPYHAELLGEVAPARPLGRTSFSLLYRFTDVTSGTVTARGRTVVVSFDYAAGGKAPIPTPVRSAFEPVAVDPSSEGW